MQADPNQMPAHFPLIVPVLAIAFFCFISYLTSVISGWHRLAQCFRAQSEPYGETKSAGPFPYTVYTRYWSHYGSVIKMTAADDGLYLSVFFLLRFGHPPLRIPWTEIEISRTRRFLQNFIVLTLGRRERIPMRISERMANKLGLLARLPS